VQQCPVSLHPSGSWVPITAGFQTERLQQLAHRLARAGAGPTGRQGVCHPLASHLAPAFPLPTTLLPTLALLVMTHPECCLPHIHSRTLSMGSLVRLFVLVRVCFSLGRGGAEQVCAPRIPAPAPLPAAAGAQGRLRRAKGALPPPTWRLQGPGAQHQQLRAPGKRTPTLTRWVLWSVPGDRV